MGHTQQRSGSDISILDSMLAESPGKKRGVMLRGNDRTTRLTQHIATR